MPFNWTCPFCDRAQTVTDEQVAIEGVGLPLAKHKYEQLGAEVSAIACANPDCLEVTISLSLSKLSDNPRMINNHHRTSYNHFASPPIFKAMIRPDGLSRPQPDYIPEVLRENYNEACLIRDRSPKAAATLARRCLQGMIRDFCGISRGRLIDEINALRDAVDGGTAPAGVTSETIDAIDSVRSIGNIGAHMEKDINIIVEVDPDEAQMLIGLIELLFQEWYVARRTRQERLAKITALSGAKKAELEAAKLSALPKPTGQGIDAV